MGTSAQVGGREAARAEGGLKGARPTIATIDLAALAANFAEIRRRAGGLEPIAVVKADAYGHGAVPVAARLVREGCRRLAVVTLDEAAALREGRIEAPLLLLGGVHDAAEARDAAHLGLTPVVHHAAHVSLLAGAASEARQRIAVHLEVDTGMRRMGVPTGSALELLARLAREPELDLEGVFTHLACADEEDLGPSRDQLEQFGRLLEAARQQGIAPPLVHVANSAGLLAGPGLARFTPPAVSAARPGLALYGVRPAPHLPGELRPVMTLRTRVVHVRRVSPGEGVGYGWTHRARRLGYVATLPIGYGDGVPWSASNRAWVWLGGRRVPLVGRVSMDFITVDVGEDPVERGDEAILFGAGPEGTPGVEEWAGAAGTIPYEVLVGIGSRVPRVPLG